MNFVCNLFLVNQPEHEANIVVVEIGQKPEVSLFTAHQIRISDIFPGSENLILPTMYAVLHRLSCEGCTSVELELAYMVVK